ncbi:potassium channel family protein [Jonquetella anthropi]|uniref:potassium channel family protein n=1 Tax=Jonquetella anthropi TaxID=428712 RepID=UPI0001B911C4|nr:TrkA family potassium uptake protein [Jonquetella anthropi]EEX48509.1 TrkA N-terminal domain protein [Jonquetella anthropi E3_33 E1]
MPAASHNYFIIGLGRFGQALCERLSALGQYVIAADSRMDRVEAISPKVAYAVRLDGTDHQALINAGVQQADVAVVAIGADLESSILCTAILKELEIPKVIARAQTALHARVLTRVGASRVVFPERDLGTKLAEQEANRWLAGFYQVGTNYSMAELAPMPSMIGKSLKDHGFRNRFNANVVLIKRQDEQIFPSPETVIQADDLLYVVGDTANLTEWADKLNKTKEE